MRGRAASDHSGSQVKNSASMFVASVGKLVKEDQRGLLNPVRFHVHGDGIVTAAYHDTMDCWNRFRIQLYSMAPLEGTYMVPVPFEELDMSKWSKDQVNRLTDTWKSRV